MPANMQQAIGDPRAKLKALLDAGHTPEELFAAYQAAKSANLGQQQALGTDVLSRLEQAQQAKAAPYGMSTLDKILLGVGGAATLGGLLGLGGNQTQQGLGAVAGGTLGYLTGKRTGQRAARTEEFDDTVDRLKTEYDVRSGLLGQGLRSAQEDYSLGAGLEQQRYGRGREAMLDTERLEERDYTRGLTEREREDRLTREQAERDLKLKQAELRKQKPSTTKAPPRLNPKQLADLATEEVEREYGELANTLLNKLVLKDEDKIQELKDYYGGPIPARRMLSEIEKGEFGDDPELLKLARELVAFKESMTTQTQQRYTNPDWRAKWGVESSRRERLEYAYRNKKITRAEYEQGLKELSQSGE